MLPKRFNITLLCLVSLIVLATLAKEENQDVNRVQMRTEFRAVRCNGKKCQVENLFASDPFEALEIRVQLEENGTIAQFNIETLQATAGNKRRWYGEDADGMHTMNLVEDDNSIFGSVNVGNTVYSIGVDADGESVVTARDTADYPPESPSPDEDVVFNDSGNSTRSLATSSYEVGDSRGTITETSNAEQQALNFNITAGAQSIMTPSEIGATSIQSENASRDLQGSSAPHSFIDIMVVWSSNAECRNAGLARGCTRTAQTENSILGLINLAVLETNVAFEKSGIFATVRLIHAYIDTSYTEPSDNAFGSALSDISNTNGVMDDVHEKRERYGADMVHFLIDDTKYCGIAYVGPRRSSMFSVSNWDCATGYYSFGHEIAHNMVSCALVLLLRIRI